MFPIRFSHNYWGGFRIVCAIYYQAAGPNSKISHWLAKLNFEKCISIETVLQCGLDLNGEFKKSKHFVPFVANRKFHACRLATRPCVLWVEIENSVWSQLRNKRFGKGEFHCLSKAKAQAHKSDESDSMSEWNRKKAKFMGDIRCGQKISLVNIIIFTAKLPAEGLLSKHFVKLCIPICRLAAKIG